MSKTLIHNFTPFLVVCKNEWVIKGSRKNHVSVLNFLKNKLYIMEKISLFNHCVSAL